MSLDEADRQLIHDDIVGAVAETVDKYLPGSNHGAEA